MEFIEVMLYYFVASFILISSIILSWHMVLDKKINFKDVKIYIALILLMIITLLNYFNVNAYIRIFLMTIFLILFFKYLFRENLRKVIITPIFIQLVYMISEMIFVVMICSILDIENNGIINTFFGTLLSNTCISCIAVILVCFPFTKKLYKSILLLTNKVNQKFLLIISFVFVAVANLLTMILYYRIQFRYLLIFNTILTICCFVIVMYVFKTKNNYIKINEKFNTTLNSLKEYEDILDKYRISTHENKNELLTIRNLIPKNNKKTITYIDKLIENKIKDNDKIMLESAKIPNGGLRGLIYSKLLLMKELKIEYNLIISNNIKTVDLIKKIDDLTMLDICKIIGVYIDNSIQEVKDLKEKNISLEMYIEHNELIISISNNYANKIELNKLDDAGYTTKGNNHGYGLTLVKQIINTNNKIQNQRKITKQTFSQILKIKM